MRARDELANCEIEPGRLLGARRADDIIAALRAAGYELRKIPTHSYDYDCDGKHICPTCTGPVFVSPDNSAAKEQT